MSNEDGSKALTAGVEKMGKTDQLFGREDRQNLLIDWIGEKRGVCKYCIDGGVVYKMGHHSEISMFGVRRYTELGGC